MGKVYERTKGKDRPRKTVKRDTGVSVKGKGDPGAETTKTTRYSAPQKKKGMSALPSMAEIRARRAAKRAAQRKKDNPNPVNPAKSYKPRKGTMD